MTTPIMDDEDAVRADYEKLKELLKSTLFIADEMCAGLPDDRRVAWRIVRGNTRLALDLLKP